jgi:hypothetical protein
MNITTTVMGLLDAILVNTENCRTVSRELQKIDAERKSLRERFDAVAPKVADAEHLLSLTYRVAAYASEAADTSRTEAERKRARTQHSALLVYIKSSVEHLEIEA